MKAPTTRVERIIREASLQHADGTEILAWLDGEQARSKRRGYCQRCEHRAMYHGYSEPENGVYEAACQESDCECEEYQPQGTGT